MARSRRIAIAGAALAVVSIGVFLWLRPPKVRTAVARTADLQQRLVASGRVMPPARINISAVTSGLVLAVGAVEGRHVRAGDLLLQIDDAQARNDVAQAKAAVAQASAKVEQLRRVGAIVATESLGQSQTNLAKALADLERTQRLAASGAATAVELDNARRAVELFRAQKAAAEAQQAAAQPMGADSRVALANLLHAQTQLAGAMVRLAQTRISAPHDGTVLSRSVETGDVAQPGRVLMVLAADGDVQLVFNPDERNLAVVQLGQRARAAADAYPQEVFDAEVSYIAPAVDPQRGSIEVRLSVAHPPPFLRPDMTVSIDLAVAEREQALTIPKDAVRGFGTSLPWVLRVEGGRAQRREVKLGIAGEGAVEVRDGLREGDEVVVPGERAIAPGRRVRTERID